MGKLAGLDCNGIPCNKAMKDFLNSHAPTTKEIFDNAPKVSQEAIDGLNEGARFSRELVFPPLSRHKDCKIEYFGKNVNQMTREELIDFIIMLDSYVTYLGDENFNNGKD